MEIISIKIHLNYFWPESRRTFGIQSGIIIWMLFSTATYSKSSTN